MRCPLPFTCVLAALSLLAQSGPAQNQPARVIAFGAHPDDCDLGAGGLAAKYAARGDKVKFVSLTNGDAGHQSMRGRGTRQAEACGSTLDVREQVIREIRQWKTDIVIAPRPNDYHPDHRYTGVLVQDASYIVIVPDLVTDTPPLKRNPVFLYYSDRFTRPQPFRADIVVSIDDVFEKKINMLDAHGVAAMDRGAVRAGAKKPGRAEEMAGDGTVGFEKTADGVGRRFGEALWRASGGRSARRGF